MSKAEIRHEAKRWLRTARQDYEAAVCLLQAGHHAQACFLAQQCAEKAIKAVWFALDRDPWGHSVQKLLVDLAEPSLSDDEPLAAVAARLDRFYIPTRYPNGIPDLTPGETYHKDDSTEALGYADKILQAVARVLADRPDPSCAA